MIQTPFPPKILGNELIDARTVCKLKFPKCSIKCDPPANGQATCILKTGGKTYNYTINDVPPTHSPDDVAANLQNATNCSSR
jgi:hypothetical protein